MMTTNRETPRKNPRQSGKWLLKPLNEFPLQAYVGKHLRAIGICKQVIAQIGACHVWVSSYSTSEDFLRGFRILRKKEAVLSACLVIDTKAAAKISKLSVLAKKAFDRVFLGMNHSKVMLFENEASRVVVLTSMNQTYGSRAESTVFIKEDGVFFEIKEGIKEIASHAMEYGIHRTDHSEGGGTGGGSFDDPGDFRPFGAEW